MPTSLLSGRSRLPLFSLVIMDVAIAFGCAELSEWVRFGEHATHYLNYMYMQALLVVVFAFLCDVYAPWRGRRISERLSEVAFAWALPFVALGTFLVMTQTADNVSRLWLGTWILLSIPTALLVRFALYQLLMSFRRRGRNTRHVLVIGDGRDFLRQCRSTSPKIMVMATGCSILSNTLLIIRHWRSWSCIWPKIKYLMSVGSAYPLPKTLFYSQ